MEEARGEIRIPRSEIWRKHEFVSTSAYNSFGLRVSDLFRASDIGPRIFTGTESRCRPGQAEFWRPGRTLVPSVKRNGVLERWRVARPGSSSFSSSSSSSKQTNRDAGRLAIRRPAIPEFLHCQFDSENEDEDEDDS